MRENRLYGSMRGGGGKTGLTTTVSSIRAEHPAYSTSEVVGVVSSRGGAFHKHVWVEFVKGEMG
jgi:hypothetical protein